MTGGRIKRIAKYLDGDDVFMLAYGDGVGDIDINGLLAFHRAHGRLATVTGAQPPGRFGQLSVRADRVVSFQEKPEEEGGWINAGFFVLSSKVIDYIADDSTTFEREPLERLAREGQLSIYRHLGFWRPMDTLRDKIGLDEMWQTGQAAWKVW